MGKSMKAVELAVTQEADDPIADGV